MFDFGVGYSELFVLAVIAVIVIGPKDLPRVLRTFGQMMNKARGFAREFQGHVDAAMKDAGADGLKKDFQDLKSTLSTAGGAPDVKPASSPVKSLTPPPMGLSTATPSHQVKDYESYFGPAGAGGETRVAGNLHVDG